MAVGARRRVSTSQLHTAGGGGGGWETGKEGEEEVETGWGQGSIDRTGSGEKL